MQAPKKNQTMLVWLLVAALVFLLVLGYILVKSAFSIDDYDPTDTPPPFENHLALVKLRGMIVDAEDDSIFSSGNSMDSVEKYLRQAIKDNHIKGVLLRIDSPGGTIATSQEIYSLVKTIREEGKPVVVSMADVAASGGYYIACASNYIFAMPGTLTGSIGVIANLVNLQPLEQKLGIEPEIVKSGLFKDIGSPNRQMTPQEKTILQNLIMDAYNQFVDAVASGRKMDRKLVISLADGRVYSGQQALKFGLIDSLGGYDQALAKLQKLAQEANHTNTTYRIYEESHGGLIKTIKESLNSQSSFGLDSLFPAWMHAKYNKVPMWLMQ